MSDAGFLTAIAAIVAGSFAAAWSLRRAWRLKAGKTSWRGIGLALLGVTLLWPAWIIGEARGPFVAVNLLSVVALGVVASSYTFRPHKAGRVAREGLAPEPAERASSAWRTTLRWSLAGPIGMVAAMSLGISYAVWAPGEIQTRLLIGGLIVPLAWGSAMAWTLADSRILRATFVLVGTAIVGFGAATLKGLA
ncbi:MULTISPECIES: hypothetical protein [unclassified Sphingobium]|uniref:hypothetical protein n=1 Tax=unclassified Sphingobium TaxID=2611147 RepID=UPI002225A6C8|nr:MULTISPECIES: hypothetical protein [unclassified Sphingobium]MCW2413366.1 hypothetical protein [Sphingobium sp. B8D3D]MCW2414335.1 hypothetical protein [Sphingobium sp. B8D3A]